VNWGPNTPWAKGLANFLRMLNDSHRMFNDSKYIFDDVPDRELFIKVHPLREILTLMYVCRQRTCDKVHPSLAERANATVERIFKSPFVVFKSETCVLGM